MIPLENRLITTPTKGAYTERYIKGYFLTILDLEQLVRDFQVDCHDGFVSNDNAYLEEWLKSHNRIEK